jgi:hypothetical protein
MRLIDADALIKELHHAIEGHIDLTKDYEYLGIDDYIRSMPTAYDIEKVVAELEEEKFDIEGCRYDVDLNTTIDMAIDIVKAGGVE